MLQTCYSTLETPPPPPPVDTWHLLMQSYYSSPVMGRKKLALKKIENSTARQVTYSKRKDGMIKKAHELAVLCDIDIALIMFSPSGRLTTFSSSRRVEDIFLRFLCRPDELKGGSNSSQELLIQKLRKLKFEAEMLEKASQIEELEAKLEQLSKRKHETMEKMRHYQPELQRINTSIDVDVHIQFIEGALNGVHMARARLLGKEVIPEGTGNTEGLPSNSEVAAFSMVAESSTTNNEYADHHQTRGIGVQERELIMEEYQPIGPHLSLDYIRRAQNQWYTFPSQRTPSPAYL